MEKANAHYFQDARGDGKLSFTFYVCGAVFLYLSQRPFLVYFLFNQSLFFIRLGARLACVQLLRKNTYYRLQWPLSFIHFIPSQEFFPLITRRRKAPARMHEAFTERRRVNNYLLMCAICLPYLLIPLPAATRFQGIRQPLYKTE